VAHGDRRRAGDAHGHGGAQPRAVRPSHRHRRPPHARGRPRPGAGDPRRLGRGRAQRRAAALRPQERLAELLGARTEELVCEELALRARLDLDHRRLALAAIELDAALDAARGELDEKTYPALAPRVDELRALHEGLAATARGASPGAASEDALAPEEETVRHALERLEAALRARTAGGFTRG
jgi:hypothetical protein